jgi:hypothetical protein
MALETCIEKDSQHVLRSLLRVGTLAGGFIPWLKMVCNPETERLHSGQASAPDNNICDAYRKRNGWASLHILSVNRSLYNTSRDNLKDENPCVRLHNQT